MKGSRGNPNDLLSNQPQHPQKGKEYLDLRNQQLVTDYMKINVGWAIYVYPFPRAQRDARRRSSRTRRPSSRTCTATPGTAV
eukprot:1097251-Pyramimonas_sp.AAC.1